MRQRTTTRVLALDDGADGRSVETAVDEVAFPVTRQQSLLDFLRAMHDAQGFRHRLATRQRRATPTANVLALAQRLDHAELQRSSRIGVNRGVNRLVADAAVGIVGMHHAQSGRNLLRRPTVIHQSVVNVLEQRRAFLQAPPTTTAQTTAAIGLRRRRGVVAAARVRRRRRNVVTRELAADARCIPSQSSGHRTHARSAATLDHDHRSIFNTKMPILFVHRNTLRQGVALES